MRPPAVDSSGTLAGVNVVQPVVAPGRPIAPVDRVPLLGVLRALLIGEAVLGLALAIFLSVVAAALADILGGDAGQAAEERLRFAAGGAIIVAIGALIASRGARRRRPWAWTLAALLQLVLAIGTGVAILVAGWHPVELVGFGLAVVVMLVLSTAAVRRGLGQE